MNGDQGVMRIGEVHAQLRKYFPDIELSKIRYYEDKGSCNRVAAARATACTPSVTSVACAKRSDWPKKSSCRCAWCVCD